MYGTSRNIRIVLRNLPPDVRGYLLIGHVLITAVINLVVTFCVGFLTFSDAAHVVIWEQDKGAFTDLLGTCFLLPVITTLIATPIVRRQAGNGTVSRISPDAVPRILQWYQRRTFVRSLRFGISTVIVFILPLAMAFWWSSAETIPTPVFLTIKVIFAVILGMIVTPVIALTELSSPSPGASSHQ